MKLKQIQNNNELKNKLLERIVNEPRTIEGHQYFQDRNLSNGFSQNIDQPKTIFDELKNDQDISNHIANYRIAHEDYTTIPTPKKGKKCFISQIPYHDENFVTTYQKWWNDPDTKNGTDEQTDHTLEETLDLLFDCYHNDKHNLTFAVYDNFTGKYIGDVNLKDTQEFIDGPEFAIMIGPEGRGKGMATEATKLMLDYAFNTIGVDVVNLCVYKDRTHVHNIYLKAGFEDVREKPDENGRMEYEMKITKERFNEIYNDSNEKTKTISEKSIEAL